ncbi:hypothetical protein GCM10027199_30770 [Amycolatopsis magusensis]
MVGARSVAGRRLSGGLLLQGAFGARLPVEDTNVALGAEYAPKATFVSRSAGWGRADAVNVAFTADSAVKATFTALGRPWSVTNVAFGTLDVSKATFVTVEEGVRRRASG